MKARILAALALLTLSGCSLIPWHPFGTPVTRVATAEARVDLAQSKAGDVLTEEIVKTSAALDEAASGNPRGIPVARQHVAVARTLAVQIFGAPTVSSEAGWRDLVARQTSLDDKVRAIAETENTKRTAQISKLSADLEAKDVALESANKRVAAYAAEKEAIADKFLKLCWVAGILVGLYFLGQGLQLVASFNPAFQGAANLVNTFVSPVMHSGFSKARKALAASRE
jgi:hypothetical protein